MELLSEISDSIDSLVQLNRDKLSQHLKNIIDSRCIINEDSDLYGFSLIHDDIDDSRRSSSSSVIRCDDDQTRAKDVIQRFQSDDNWFNSKAVDLMCESYGINSTNQYSSLLLHHLSRGQVGRGTNNSNNNNNKNNNSTTYLTIKREQNHMFARNLFKDGVHLMRAMKYDDAVKKLSDAIHFNDRFIDAYMERAQAYELLSLQQEALNDYNKVKELRAATVADDDDDTMVPSSSKLFNNSDLITKLQYSIYQDSSSTGKGSTQRRTHSIAAPTAVRGGGSEPHVTAIRVGGSEPHVRTAAKNIQYILSPDSSSTTDSSSNREDHVRGSSKHDDAVDGDGDDDSLGHRKKKRKREKHNKKKHKKKVKKMKKKKTRKQSD